VPSLLDFVGLGMFICHKEPDSAICTYNTCILNIITFHRYFSFSILHISSHCCRKRLCDSAICMCAWL